MSATLSYRPEPSEPRALAFYSATPPPPLANATLLITPHLHYCHLYSSEVDQFWRYALGKIYTILEGNNSKNRQESGMNLVLCTFPLWHLSIKFQFNTSNSHGVMLQTILIHVLLFSQSNISANSLSGDMNIALCTFPYCHPSAYAISRHNLAGLWGYAKIFVYKQYTKMVICK